MVLFGSLFIGRVVLHQLLLMVTYHTQDNLDKAQMHKSPCSSSGLKISVGHQTLSGMKFNMSGVIWSSNRQPVRHKILVPF